MPTTDDDRVHERLGHEECLRLLSTTGIGRLAYTQSALPAVRPVSFLLRADAVLIPARAGSPLVDAVRGAVVAFETDRYDEADRTGWTVTVVGPTRLLAGVSGPGAAAELCAIAVRLDLVQGWRTGLPA